jgi:apolipoprotein D and lipocalin family protein
MVVVVLALSFFGCARNTNNLKVVTGFSLDRYLGKWFETARHPHSFEKGLTKVNATYTKRPDGMIEILNTGFSPAKGAWRTAKGKLS